MFEALTRAGYSIRNINGTTEARITEDADVSTVWYLGRIAGRYRDSAEVSFDCSHGIARVGPVAEFKSEVDGGMLALADAEEIEGVQNAC